MSETSVLPSLFLAACLFHTLIHYQVFTLHVWLVSLSYLLPSPALLVITLSLCSRPVFLCFTWDLFSPSCVLPYCLILSATHYSLQFSTSLYFSFSLTMGFSFPLSLSDVETPHHLSALNTFFSLSSAFFFHSSLAVRLSTHRHVPVRQTLRSGDMWRIWRT